VLIDAYHDQIHSTILQDPTLTVTILQSIKAFIDDVAMSASATSNNYNELCDRAQTQLIWWNQLINITGGELNPTKCCSAVYLWQPDKLGFLRPTQPKPNDPPITLADKNPNDVITRLLLLEGMRYLGVYLAPDGSSQTMEGQLWKKAVTYTTAFQRTHMSRCKAGVLYQACFIPALTYPLPATWLPLTFLDRIHKLSTSITLNKMGFH